MGRRSDKSCLGWVYIEISFLKISFLLEMSSDELLFRSTFPEKIFLGPPIHLDVLSQNRCHQLEFLIFCYLQRRHFLVHPKFNLRNSRTLFNLQIRRKVQCGCRCREEVFENQYTHMGNRSKQLSSDLG